MKNLTQFHFLLLVVLILFSFQTLIAQVEKPQKVLRIVYEKHPNEWYLKQAELWKNEIDKNSQNAEAWYNYYNANRYGNYVNTIDTKPKKERLAKIIEDMGKAIPETYEFYLLAYWNKHDLNDISLIEKAYAINPDRPDTYYPLIDYYELRGEHQKANEFYKKLYKSQDISPWLLSYNYNVLMSLERDAIILTNGDNDSYPAWMLQNVLGIREDVSVVNISFATTKTFLKYKLKDKNISIDRGALMKKALITGADNQKQFSLSVFTQELAKTLSEKYPQYPVYFALTVYENHLIPLKNDLYIVGLAYNYSKKRVDNIALLKKNYEEKFGLDYLTHDWYTESYPGKTNRTVLHMNYIPSMSMLVEHYKTSGDLKLVEKWKKIMINIAEEAGRKEELLQDFKNKGI
jgi:hypothetical protein